MHLFKPTCVVCDSPMVAGQGEFIPGDRLKLAFGVKAGHRTFMYFTCREHMPNLPGMMKRIERALLHSYRRGAAFRILRKNQ